MISRTEPGQLRTKLGLLSVDTEPHCSSGVPAVDVCTIWNFGEVGLEWTWVVGIGIDVDGDLSSCSDGCSRLTSTELVAADVAAGYIADEAIVLPVLGLSDGSPGRASVDERECIWSYCQYLAVVIA